MDSINQNQEEKNHEDLSGSKAIEKLKELVEKAGSCFFCTNIQSNQSFSARPMAVQQTDEEGNLWFLSASDSKKNDELAANSSVQLLFQGSGYADFLSVYGKAVVSTNKQKIAELWNPILKTWFTEGQDDPRITVIQVIPSEAYYWDTKHNIAVGFFKRIAGAIMGKTLDDSIEGNITV
jgi:general stress protein 26